jgi:REP element-mobilizing transposase RayT
VVNLSPLGEIVDSAWTDLPCRFPQCETDAFVIMPNHVHGILVLVAADPVEGADEEAAARFGGPTALLSTVVGALKSGATRRINEMRCVEGADVWQRGFFERIIRSERMLNALREYIERNPANWDRDSENV